jgi:hypothetical protein
MSKIKAVADIAGIVGNVATSITDAKTKRLLAKTGDKTQNEANAHNEHMAMLNFRSQNSYNAVNRNKFDSLVDGLNRFVFPATAFPFIFLLWKKAIEDPNGLLDALGTWGLLSVVGTLLGVRQFGKYQTRKNEEKKIDTVKEIQKEEIKNNTLLPEKKLKIEYAEDCKGKLSNPKTVEMVKILGKKIEADKIIITGADRNRISHNKLIKSGATKSPYEKTQHGKQQKYKAADIKVFKNGEQIEPSTVGSVAETIPIIGGVGIYKTFTHIDHRDRKANGDCYKWGS